MKRITLATFLFLLAGCQNPSSSIKTIQCEQRYIPDSANLGWEKYEFGNNDRLIFDKDNGQTFRFDEFREELYPETFPWKRESVSVNGKLKIKDFIKQDEYLFANSLFVLDLKTLKGNYKSVISNNWENNFDIKCKYIKNKTTKIKDS